MISAVLAHVIIVINLPAKCYGANVIEAYWQGGSGNQRIALAGGLGSAVPKVFPDIEHRRPRVSIGYVHRATAIPGLGNLGVGAGLDSSSERGGSGSSTRVAPVARTVGEWCGPICRPAGPLERNEPCAVEDSPPRRRSFISHYHR